MSAAGSSSGAPSPAEQAVLEEFNGRRQRLVDCVRKIEELSQEVTEHELVIKTLEPMDKGRRCFRLIGDVLVERTVGETLPAVTKNKESLEGVIKTLTSTMREMEKQLAEFQAKHKIRFVNRQGQPIDAPADADSSEAAGSSKGAGSSSSKAQGVLVK